MYTRRSTRIRREATRQIHLLSTLSQRVLSYSPVAKVQHVTVPQDASYHRYKPDNWTRSAIPSKRITQTPYVMSLPLHQGVVIPSSRISSIFGQKRQPTESHNSKSSARVPNARPSPKTLVSRSTAALVTQDVSKMAHIFLETIVLLAFFLLIPAQPGSAQTTSTTYSPVATFAAAGGPVFLFVYGDTLFSSHNTGKYLSRWNMSTNALIRSYAIVGAPHPVFAYGG
jgi:hypothetical protein